MRPWTIPTMISLTAHVILLFLLVQNVGAGESQAPGGMEGASKRGRPGGDTVSVTIISKATSPGSLSTEACDEWYGGIGITMDFRRATLIESVAPGYAAWRAGIRAGDIVISDYYDIRGEPGTLVVVKVLRDGKELSFNMVREKICTVEG